MSSTPHTYEEVRDVVVEILLGSIKTEYQPTQFQHLKLGVDEVFQRREQTAQAGTHVGNRYRGHDAELVRDVFWDLFRQGYITLGLNDSNEIWPFFRLSQFGQQALAAKTPYRFHDTSTFIKSVREAVPDLSNETVVYLEEAATAFYAGCLLSSCMMVGVAAEVEFNRLLRIAANSRRFTGTFTSAAKEYFLLAQIKKFQAALKPIQGNFEPSKNFADLDTNLTAIQSVLRVARNEVGHPSGSKVPDREQVYVYLQLFSSFARQVMHLRCALS